MKIFWTSLKMLIGMTILTGIVYPLIITGIAYLFMHKQATGDIIYVKDKPIGAKLIAQKFENPKYFWPRPSANDYDALNSGGSNLGPTSKKLQSQVEKRLEIIKKDSQTDKIPSELLYASGSGLDPHISVNCALFQLDRIAKTRGVDKEKIKSLIDQLKVNRLFGLADGYVNVLELNLALDESESKK